MTANVTVEREILRYQPQRGFDDVQSYATGLQLLLTSGRRVYLALAETEFAFYFDDNRVLHYDLEARLVKFTTPDQFRRRGLSHQVLLTRKRTPEEGGGLTRQTLPAQVADALVDAAHTLVAEVEYELRKGAGTIEFAKPDRTAALAQLQPLLQRAANFDVRAAQREAARFAEVYGRVAVLPPDQYNALVLQATEGCAYSACLFCNLYRGVFYGQKTPAQFRKHLQNAVAFHGQGLRQRRGIFLGEANALMLPQPTLLEIFQILNEHFELPPADQTHVPAKWWLGSETRFDGVSSFLDVFTGRPHTAEEFHDLRARGLRRVYIGLETGDETLLRWLCKPATAEKVRRTIRALKEAQLSVGVTVLLGAGGRQFHESHVRETVRLLNELTLGKGDYIYFSPIVIYQQSRYAEQTSAIEIEPLTPAEIHAQEQAIRSRLFFDDARGRPYLARYELETFVY